MVIFMDTKPTITIIGFAGEKVQTTCAWQCSFCVNMIDSFTCKIYPTIEHDIPFKYRLGKEVCPDFIQVEADKTSI